MSDDSTRMLAAWAAGDIPDGVAAMRLLAGVESAAQARVAAAGGGAGALRPLLTDAAHELVRRMLALADHAAVGTPEAWAAVFDRAAALSPEGSVALYSLGDADQLARATEEVVSWLRDEALIGPDRRVLEIGCGIGRFVVELAPLNALTIGLDVSPVMVAEAARRTAGRPGAGLVRTAGRDLAAFSDAAFQTVLAIDSWPYVVNADLTAPMLYEASRVLAPGGDLVVLNWSYRGDADEDREEAAELAAACGLVAVEGAAPTLRHWNGALFRFRRG